MNKKKELTMEELDRIFETFTEEQKRICKEEETQIENLINKQKKGSPII